MKNIIFFWMCFIIQIGYSQIDTGIITYKIVLNSDSNKNEFVEVAVEKTRSLEFTLQFDKYSSLYKETEGVDSNDTGSKLAAAFSGYTNPVYYKKESKEFFYNNSISPFFDNEEYLIKFKDTIEWELINETKIINGYKCYKAKKLAPFFTEKISYYTVTAWYCPEIPAPYGPLCFAGLPGLIFELQNKFASIVIDKIELNKKIKFEEIKIGKLVTEIEFMKIFQEKFKQYDSSSKK